MNITARRISGNIFTPDDVLEINFDGDSKALEYMYYSIEVVEGPSVTHGGGGIANEYLNYKSHDDVVDGDIDYSTCEMKVNQTSMGVSTIKIKGKYLTKEKFMSYIADFESWKDTALAVTSTTDIDESTMPNVDEYVTIIETGEITLNWSEDVFA